MTVKLWHMRNWWFSSLILLAVACNEQVKSPAEKPVGDTASALKSAKKEQKPGPVQEDNTNTDLSRDTARAARSVEIEAINHRAPAQNEIDSMKAAKLKTKK